MQGSSNFGVPQPSDGDERWAIWWIGELSGAASADEPRVQEIRQRREVESLLGQLKPSLRIRCEDLSTLDGVVDARLSFSRMSDFECDAFERAVPAVARCGPGIAGGEDLNPGSPSRQPGPAVDGDLSRMIADALRGGVAPSGGDTLRSRQIALLREDAALSRLERSWRSLHRLAAAAESGPVGIHAIDIADAPLHRALADLASGAEPELLDFLEQLFRDTANRPELIVLDSTLAADPSGFEAMRGLAVLAPRLGAPVAFGFAHAWLDGAGSASSIDRAFRDLTLAPFRTLREDPASVLLCAVLPPILRPRTEPVDSQGSSPWLQSGGAALAEGLVRSISTSGRRGRSQGPVACGEGVPSRVLPEQACDALAGNGFCALMGDPTSPGAPESDQLACSERSVRSGWLLATCRAEAGEIERARADLRVRMVIARLSKSIARVVADLSLPAKDSDSLGRFAARVAAALPQSDLRLLGSGPSEALEAAPSVHLVARYQSHDERSLRFDLEIVAATASGQGGILARAAVLPLA